ncbi:MAG: tRNA (N6-threonylcarbamoyladenosine(37)-N6)-methyltransferase TrmO [Nitrososphaerota archaeon]|jgi:tRNA-Thr(GGU) m(6)t(6)A37 methyltransferase TsaA|nr:tRNA (N6-threonylcarbamoyladenosine(37)-N6)-methyltransferase TrmO [Nitrososphaerota archaeon]MDG6928274.1 tRNA (N6-threonylcarbamoyladenosine(37)-N6)-methyltransferase TrmO [Nitrososphaerota archaeon]MDG6931182.1 tRNA (N6-threonylcarbamoyladenosine(37)-N6)-methyltransferase TrmO [Nitrososphaerota archaeon]MDG6932829.1 tRNA (N6-threonylcarbamoyladenosine(37)-N6)-methyltransferase TrmO [Nitrososphaerota archaeon]MDG6935644.1 tRNA (N6-threonylcarbamoyladenosine(37)-N6)-methyltransferase TrmO [
MQKIVLEPIGSVKVLRNEENIRGDHAEVVSEITIFDQFKDGLKGLEGFSHVIVLCYFDKLRDFEKGVLLVKPRRLTRYGVPLESLPEVGVFSLDSPNRPNPIAISIVELINVNQSTITVRGLDAFDGTPVVDIKPYTPDRAICDIKLPEWYSSLLKKLNIKEI